MSVVWIVHRDPRERAALARLAGVSEAAVLGAPGDAIFRDAPAPDAVLLGVAGDLEAELEFVHRTSNAARRARFVLVGDADRLERARALFDTLPAVALVSPPAARQLRAALRGSEGERPVAPLPLSQRPARDALAARFTRAFADLDPPTLLRALDPRLADVPLLLLGETGSGRETLARYVHHFGGTAGGVFVELPCTADVTADALVGRIAGARRAPGAEHAVTLWLAQPSRLAPAVQEIVRGFVEYGLPPGTVAARRVRWIAADAEERIEPSLERALAGLTLRVPPLREQTSAIPNLVAATADHWCRARGLPTRRFAETALAVLEEYPWPGNLRELEAVIEHSLAASGNDPLGAEDLRLDGEPLAVLDTTAPAPRAEASPTAHTEPATAPDTTHRGAEDPDVDALIAAIGPEEGHAALADDAAAPQEGADLRDLAAAVGTELRRPLSALRTFAELLPERHADPEFRDQFREQVASNVARSEQTVARLESLAREGGRAPEAIDVSALLEQLLAKRREFIRERRLVVLEELDPERSSAHCDPNALRTGLEAVLDTTFAVVPERGDVYLASRRLERGLGDRPSVRVLLRLRGPQSRHAEAAPPEAPATLRDFAVASLLIEAQEGRLTVDTGEQGETILLLDLPALG